MVEQINIGRRTQHPRRIFVEQIRDSQLHKAVFGKIIADAEIESDIIIDEIVLISRQSQRIQRAVGWIITVAIDVMPLDRCAPIILAPPRFAVPQSG